MVDNSCDREHGSERVGEMQALSTRTLARERSSERLHDEVRKDGAKSFGSNFVWKRWAFVVVGKVEASARTCIDLQRVSCAPGQIFPFRTERGLEKAEQEQ